MVKVEWAMREGWDTKKASLPTLGVYMFIFFIFKYTDITAKHFPA